MKPLSYALALTLALGAGSNVRGQNLDTTIDFPGATSTSAWGINSHGDVVGVYTLPDTSAHGFLFSGGEITSIKYPGADPTHTWGINDHGGIVGDYTIGAAMHGFLLSNGRFSNVDYPGSIAGGPAAINNSGQIAGAYTVLSPGKRCAKLWYLLVKESIAHAAISRFTRRPAIRHRRQQDASLTATNPQLTPSFQRAW